MSNKSDKRSDKKPLPESILLPSSIFRDRSLKVLETLVEYLKDQQHLTFHEIAVLLNRNDRTIWTVYSRAKKKRQQGASSEKVVSDE